MRRRKYRDYIGILLITIAVTFITIFFSFVSDRISRKSFSDTGGQIDDDSIVIVIDAGHGGEDGGASGADGTLEKDINLSVAKYLESLLLFTDFNVVMTRSDDRLLYMTGQENRKKFYDVRNRVAVTENYSNSLLVSIHQNKFPVNKYKGLQVYYSTNNSDSKTLAGLIQQNVKSYLQPDNTREIKPAGSNIYILHKSKVPAVLVECGFLSNPEDLENLKTTEYQKKIAFIMFASLTEFLSQK